MRNLNNEVGCVFDTLVFFSNYFEEMSERNNLSEDKDAKTLKSRYYEDIKQRLQQEGIEIPNFLYPFACRQKNSNSFLHYILFENQLYSHCTFNKLKSILHNQQYLKRSYVEYYFPDDEYSKVQKIINHEHPYVIEILEQRSLEPYLESYFLYSIIFFESVLQTLLSVVHAVYSQIVMERQSAIQQNNIHKLLRQESTLHKLKVISKSMDVNESSFIFSVLLMDADLIAYHKEEPTFFLLGYEFEKSLEVKYKYSDITPYSFARAIGNQTKYEIFQALLIKSAMSTVEICNQLRLSRGTFQYNIKEMQESRIVVADQEKGQNIYKLDIDFIRIVSGQLELAYK